MAQFSGIAVGAIAAGSVFVYAGITGRSVLSTIQQVVQGKSPVSTPKTQQILGGTTAGNVTNIPGVTANPGSPSGGTNAQNQALGKQMAAAYGWDTGAEWTALNNIVMSESGWSDTAANPTSNARGIAQNINGWSASYQEGNAQQQIAWLLSYIKGRYGDPIAAWGFHLANGWY